MDEAVARATGENLELQATSKDVAVAAGELTRGSGWLPSNPFLSGGTQTRPQGGSTVAAGSSYYYIYLSQEFEIAGQRQARVAAGEHAKERETASFEESKRTLIAAVKTNFVKVLAAEQRFDLARQAAEASARLRDGSGRKKQLTASEALDANTTRIQDEHFAAALEEAQADREDAYEELRHQLALSSDSELQLLGGLPATVEPLPAVATLVSQALEKRADLQSLRAAQQATEAQLSLEKRRRFPNVTLSGSVARFEGDTLFGGDIGFPIPVFQRNAGEIELAVAEHERSDIQMRDLQRQIDKEIHAAHRACLTKAAAVIRYRETIIPLSEENVQLQQRLWDRDESNEDDFIGARLDMLSARGDYVDALEEYQDARIELERVSGGSLEQPAQ